MRPLHRAWTLRHAGVLATLLLAGLPTRAQHEPHWSAWVQEGYEAPERVLARLAALRPPAGADDWRRHWWRTRGVVAAAGHVEAAADEALAELRGWSGPQASLARADARLVEAVRAEREGRVQDVEAAASDAEQAYAAVCAPAQLPGCDLPTWWRLLRLRALRAESQGLWIEARSLQLRAAEVADQAGDLYLQAWSLAAAAVASQRLGESDLAREQLASAQRLAVRDDRPETGVRVLLNRARVEERRGDPAAALRALDQALDTLRSHEMPRLRALVQANRADLLGRSGRSREAVASIEQALPVVRRFDDRRLDPLLQFNLGLAHLALGQVKPGQAELGAAVAQWERQGAQGALREALRQGGDALHAVGEHAQALAWLHRERRLTEAQDDANRDAALRELRQRRDQEAEHLDLDRLRAENLLATARLESQQWLRRVQWLIGGSLLAMAAMLGLLVVRLRGGQGPEPGARRAPWWSRWTRRRDPLTGLPHRRQLLAQALQQAQSPAGLRGSLVMVDIDHWARLSERLGAAAAPAVLAGMASRLRDAVRDADRLCRWSDSSFLVLLDETAPEALDQLAQRLLAAIGDTPIAHAGDHLAVTASVGVVAFPLEGEPAPVDWERALARVELAVYAARADGRDRAVRLIKLTARGDEERALLSHEFAQARQRGLVHWIGLERQSGETAAKLSTKLA
ncbi:diguanylate cyclase [Ideonella sp. 4Y16]|uniref:Diguanylate cyclase n=1 Tax=Ideonella alba TaxID=2824118 RepID=A0A941BC12_9BURK|nr:GGDEF domain-containing protein [Ideonella alba]MBQ0931455.1 diguanylate cyclase [Ideonella alba]MBQ0943760.1 diguanylate cyclase [Ideonella alba]